MSITVTFISNTAGRRETGKHQNEEEKEKSRSWKVERIETQLSTTHTFTAETGTFNCLTGTITDITRKSRKSGIQWYKCLGNSDSGKASTDGVA